ncbi:TPA: prefoldin subunit alpha [Candidatus Woesearchaeota archaeon]|nr:prefoldin subunit alpha [Candidatus Woesearchaeota archaeon]HIH32514.1 prefoldin subunit alpha [Candidatus Woesearchaeota archaeon]HIH54150.1 prefoldin subunit alpha [Candidatus Woesearchaeota archaeon]HIJ01697.1 prefoldin subunit alpha [Candidatus Woesearchaeota archaeon]HIJ13263.1 prefoldin subunit alpha [Candidatus Woesearchaeota archaeon]
MNEQEIQAAEFQIEQMQKIIESINSQLNEVAHTIEALMELKSLNNNAEILFPVANGIFVKGTISDTQNLSINVGNNVVVEKTINQSIEMMQKQFSEINDYKKQLEKQLDDMLKKLQE